MSEIQKQVKFRLIGIEILDKHYKNPIIPDLKFENFQFNIKLEASVNAGLKSINLISNIEILSENITIVLAAISINFVYELINFDEIILIENNGLLLPDSLSETLNSLSYSTARGIVFSEFKGTFLQNVILPIIDPKQLIPTNNDTRR